MTEPVPLTVAARLRAGAIIDRYRLIRPFEGGSLSQVWEAIEVGTGCQVALKFFLPDRVASVDLPDAERRFANGPARLAQLEHPNIVKCTSDGVVRSGDFLYYSMEFVPGGTLQRWYPELPCHEVVKLILQAADALVYSHSHNVVHRDIKPSNLLVIDGEEGFSVKVADFDMAASVHGEGNTTFVLVGTHEFIPLVYLKVPDGNLGRKAKRDRNVGQDMYGLAMTCAKAAMRVSAPADRAEFHAWFRPPKAGLVNTEILALVLRRALDDRPAEWYGSMAEFARDLAECLRLDARIPETANLSSVRAAIRDMEHVEALLAKPFYGIKAQDWSNALRRTQRAVEACRVERHDLCECWEPLIVQLRARTGDLGAMRQIGTAYFAGLPIPGWLFRAVVTLAVLVGAVLAGIHLAGASDDKPKSAPIAASAGGATATPPLVAGSSPADWRQTPAASTTASTPAPSSDLTARPTGTAHAAGGTAAAPVNDGGSRAVAEPKPTSLPSAASPARPPILKPEPPILKPEPPVSAAPVAAPPPSLGGQVCLSTPRVLATGAGFSGAEAQGRCNKGPPERNRSLQHGVLVWQYVEGTKCACSPR